MIAYLEENEKKRIEKIDSKLELSLIIAEFSYAELPRFFRNIIGVSGTLREMSSFKNRELKHRYKVERKYYIPSVYGDIS